jgi:hypothetical protein
MKKTIPLSVLETLQPVADANKELVKPIRDANALFHLIDIDPDSDFYFKVSKQENRQNLLHYLVEFKPRHRDMITDHGEWVTLEGILKHANNWVNTIKSFNKIRTYFDDPILQAYEDRFWQQVNIVDEDAEYMPFDFEQQQFLDDYLFSADQKIENLKTGKSENEVQQLLTLQTQARELRSELTKLPKHTIIKKLTRFWAGAQKVGLDVLKEVFIGVSAELIKRLISPGN